jgi:hypothetical protein
MQASGGSVLDASLIRAAYSVDRERKRRGLRLFLVEIAWACTISMTCALNSCRRVHPVGAHGAHGWLARSQTHRRRIAMETAPPREHAVPHRHVLPLWKDGLVSRVLL